MKLGVVGVGHAGSRIANRILAVERSSGRNLCNGNSLLINSSTPAFNTTEHIPDERRLVIGDVHRDIDGDELAGDPDLAAEVAQADRNEINRAFDLLEFHQIDGILVVAGLAGGIGGGAGAVVLDQLKAICDEPVYAVGVLPHEAEGDQRAMTAARSLRSFVERADNVLVFDNNAWLEDPPADSENTPAGIAAYEQVNLAFAKRVVTLFAAGEFDGAVAPENRMDPSDIIRTLDTGGISAIGYASLNVPSTGVLHTWLRTLREYVPWWDDGADDDEPTDAAKIHQLVRRAARSQLTVPCDTSSADRALILLTGPSRALSRRGFESGRYWLEREADIVDVMAGDVPHDRSSTLTVVVLFANVTDVQRIRQLQDQALGSKESDTTEGLRFGVAKSR